MPSKRGPLSKAETFYITEHAKSGKDIGEIASDLDRPIKSIQKCYTSAVKSVNKTSLVSEQFARHKGTVVMTENASTMSDATKKTRNLTRPQNCVTSVKK